MDEELKNLLKENIEISRESLKILKGIRRANRISGVFRIFYWLIIIGGSVGAYYYLQPYIQGAIDIFQQTQETVSGIKNTGSGINQQSISPDILKNLPPDLLKNLQNILKTQ